MPEVGLRSARAVVAVLFVVVLFATMEETHFVVDDVDALKQKQQTDQLGEAQNNKQSVESATTHLENGTHNTALQQHKTINKLTTLQTTKQQQTN